MKNQRRHVAKPRSPVPNLIVGLFALAGLAALFAILLILSPQLRQILQESNVPNDNRTWLTRSWTQSERSDEDVSTLAKILSDNGIQSIYLQTGTWHGATGQYIELPYSTAFIQRFRAENRSIGLYVWLVLPIDKLKDPTARQYLLDFAEKALQAPDFRGIHLQVRSVPNESEELILLLRDFRAILGQNAIISLTVPPDRTPLDPNVPANPIFNDNLTWSQAYKRRVLLNVDEIVLMGHASSLDNAEDYSLWLAYQVANYASLIRELGITLKYIVALPTYAAELGHDPEVENVETAILGIKAGQRRGGATGRQVDGVGLYPWDETDLFELDAYWEAWVKR